MGLVSRQTFYGIVVVTVVVIVVLVVSMNQLLIILKSNEKVKSILTNPTKLCASVR